MESTSLRDVLGVRLAGSRQWRPLSDWAVSRMVSASLSPRQDELLAVIIRDPSLAAWLLAQLPTHDWELTELSYLIEHATATGVMRRLKAALCPRQLSSADRQQFRHWWIRTAGLMRLTSVALVDQPAASQQLAALLSLSVAGEVDGPLLESGSLPRCLRVSETASLGHQIRTAIEDAAASVAQDSSAGHLHVTVAESVAFDHCLTPLHEALPRLLDLIERHESLQHDFDRQLQMQKIAAMKELAYGASHEINNPLANISSRAQVLMRDEQNPERRRSLATINSQAFRAHEMIADMMLFAKPPALLLREVPVGELIRPLVTQIGRDLADTIELTLTIDDDRRVVSVDAEQLAVALQAICANAIEAMGNRGQLAIRVSLAADPGGLGCERLEIEIEDDGPGISAAVRQHLFDPFYSGREAGRGLGFGLSKAWRIIESHGGDIVVQSESGRGATFILVLPAIASQRGSANKSG